MKAIVLAIAALSLLATPSFAGKGRSCWESSSGITCSR
jgi:hypothetical protein